MAKLTGTKPEQIPTNADLGNMAYQNGDNLRAGPITNYDSKVGINVTNPHDTFTVSGSKSESYIPYVSLYRSGPNLTSNNTISIINSDANYSGGEINYSQIVTYSNNVSNVRGSIDLNVKSTTGSILTGLTVYGTNDGPKIGVGLRTPDWKFVVQGEGSGSDVQSGHIQIRSTTAANPAGLMFINSGSTSSYNDLGSIQGIIESGNAKGALRFITRNSDGNNTDVAERMRLTSSGALLVNKTSADYGATAGFEFRSDNDTVYLANDADKALALNRNTNTGEIVSFRQNDSVIGSIQSVAGGTQTDIMIGSDATAIWFGTGTTLTDSIAPASITAGGTRPNAINLGHPNARFKDLHLSGGVYFNGSTSANFLDDYEEGTWTPSCTGSQSSSNGSYVKIGRLVVLHFYVQSNETSSSSVINITGMPFNATGVSTTSHQAQGVITYHESINTADRATAVVFRYTYLDLRNNNNYDQITYNEHSGQWSIRGSISYFTDS